MSEVEYELTETCGNEDWKSVHSEVTEDHDADIRMKTAEGDLEKDVKRECEELGGTNDCRSVSSVLTEEQDDEIKNFNAELLYDTEENFISNEDSIGDVKDDELTTYKQEIEAVRYNNVLLSSRLEQSEKNEDEMSKDIKLLNEKLKDERMKLATVETDLRKMQEENHHMKLEMEKVKKNEAPVEDEMKRLKRELTNANVELSALKSCRKQLWEYKRKERMKQGRNPHRK